MPLCCLLSRSLRHSGTRPIASHHLRQSPWQCSLRPQQQSYSAAFVKRRLAEEEKVFRDDAHRVHDHNASVDDGQEDYLDFLLDGYGTPAATIHAAEPTTATQDFTRETKEAQKWSIAQRKEGLRARRQQAVMPSKSKKPKMSAEANARVMARWKAYTTSPRKAIKMMSVESGLRPSAVLDSRWSTQLATLSRRYDALLPEYKTERPPVLTFTLAALERIELILDKLVENRRASWSLEELAQPYGVSHKQVWAETALWIMCYDPSMLLPFLEVTNTVPYPPVNWVEGCLELYAQSTTALSKHEQVNKRMNYLIKTFTGLLDRETKEQFIFCGSFVRQMLPYCSLEQVGELWAVIKLQKVKVLGFTMLHFADRFAKVGQIEKSLDALLGAKAAGVDIASVAFRSGCATLLRKASARPDGLLICLRLVEHLVSVGVRLDSRLYNILQLNAIEVGDLATAHSLYRAMREQGFEPDSYTCAIRLKACKLDVDNAHLLGEVIQDAITYGNIRTNPVVSGEALHCLTLHHAKHNPRTAFRTVAIAYTQFYDPAPLERLGLRMPAAPPTQGAEPVQRIQSTTWSVGYIIWLWLECNASSSDAVKLYNRWRQLIDAGDQELIHWTTVPHIATMFLYRFVRDKKTLIQATQVIKDMQRPLPESAGIQQARPNVYTWSIFAHGFVRNGEHKLAQQVLGYMQNKGIEPNVVTWTTLISGYAGAQDTEGLLDAIRRMQQNGEAWNEWTYEGIARYRNQQRLQELLEKQKFEQSMDFTAELKDKFEHRLVEQPVE